MSRAHRSFWTACGVVLLAWTVCADALTAEIALDAEPLPGANFASLKVSGKVTWKGASAPAENTKICLVVSSDYGTAVTQKFDYVSSSAGTFAYEVTNLDVGVMGFVTAFVEVNGTALSTTCPPVAQVTARPLAWIDENAATFSGALDSAGDWYGTNGISSVSADTIRFEAEDWSQASYFDPTNVTLAVRSSCVRDFRFTASFDYPGYYTDEDAPTIPDDMLASVTLLADESDVCSFAVVTNGAWAVVPRTTYAPQVGVNYAFLVRLDYGAHKVVYYVIDATTSNYVLLATADMPQDTQELLFEFAGSGGLEALVGRCHDANLVEAANAEYADMTAARAAVSEQKNLTPLWESDYAVTGSRGTLRLNDPNGYLHLTFDKWYHYSLVDEQGIKVYNYLAGNNWIEYADAAGVEAITGGWRVKTAQGLAYLASRAADGWLVGDIYLDKDIDLSANNWTPIAQFTGTFDGQGHTIKGLNNTNVVMAYGFDLRYPNGTTNDWDYASYGLFGCATNALFCDVGFTEVAISNEADSVATLLGVHAGGDLEVVNVTNASGVVTGGGRAVAGLLTVGGKGVAVGDVVVTGNVNRATIGGAIVNNEDGGNVAQILAGTTWETRFTGTVVATNNVAEGAFDVAWIGHEGYALALPVCNFAAAVTRTLDEDYWRYVEANSVKAVPIDPVKRTARMLAGYYSNGADNLTGQWMDTITAAESGDTVTIQGTGNTYDGWSTIDIDRDLTIDLNKNGIYCIYDCDVFNIADGVALTIKNGTVQYVAGYQAFAGDTTQLTKVTLAEECMTGSFYDRTATAPIGSYTMANGYATINLPFSSTECGYTLQGKTSLSDEWEDLDWTPGDGALTFETPATEQSGFYRVLVEML